MILHTTCMILHTTCVWGKIIYNANLLSDLYLQIGCLSIHPIETKRNKAFIFNINLVVTVSLTYNTKVNE